MTESTNKKAVPAPKGGTGLDKNTASALAYVLGPLTGIIFLVVEKDPKVRFHAMQSTVVLGLSYLLSFVIPFFFAISFVLWLLLIYKAWQGEDWEVPVLGGLAKNFLKKS